MLKNISAKRQRRPLRNTAQQHVFAEHHLRLFIRMIDTARAKTKIGIANIPISIKRPAQLGGAHMLIPISHFFVLKVFSIPSTMNNPAVPPGSCCPIDFSR